MVEATLASQAAGQQGGVKKRRKTRPQEANAANEEEQLRLKLLRQEEWRPMVMGAVPADLAHGMSVSEEGMKVSSSKGYRSCRSTHGTREGAYYFEVRIEHLGETGAARLGWAKPEAEINAPVGADAHGFCFASKGRRFHQGNRMDYGAEYKEGDVIGCYINLPPNPQPEPFLAQWRSNQYTVLQDAQPSDQPAAAPQQPPAAEAPKPPLGTIAYALNGVSQGVAFDTVQPGLYKPCVSLFSEPRQAEPVSVRLNFGPDFAFPPPEFGEGCPPPQPAVALTPPKPPPKEDPAAAKDAAEGGAAEGEAGEKKEGVEGSAGAAAATDTAAAPADASGQQPEASAGDPSAAAAAAAAPAAAAPSAAAGGDAMEVDAAAGVEAGRDPAEDFLVDDPSHV